jgi:predicted Rdx family selenoprotein
MKREQFLAQPEVESFVAWLAANLPTLTFKLRFKSSKFVPGGLQADVRGFEQVLKHYRWKASWQDTNQSSVDSQTWAETQRSLGQLREWLTSAVNLGDEQQALQACLQILRWGGVRGAIPFLHRLAAKGELSSYLQKMAGLMSLDGDNDLNDLDAISVERFDAGLTKIHALLDASGSPIYDSRVGAAIGMLYSLFRQQWTGIGKPLLAFPSGGARGSQIRNPGAFLNGLAAPQFSSISYEKWARWQVRLGWIIQALLERTGWFAEHGALPARCHAFEASLFMLGYDLRCFGGTPKVAVPVVAKQESERDSTGWVPTGNTFNQVIKDYLEFRRNGGQQDKASFIDWLSTHRPISRTTAQSYCFAFSMQEFDLFDRSLKELERIAAGGKDGLCTALSSEVPEPFTLGDERISVCLVDVLITGRAYQRETTGRARVESILSAGYAGTENTANTLLALGRNVGKHFDLLDAKHLPTPLFEQFFRDCTLDA